jgi:hypothetical protein
MHTDHVLYAGFKRDRNVTAWDALGGLRSGPPGDAPAGPLLERMGRVPSSDG